MIRNLHVCDWSVGTHGDDRIDPGNSLDPQDLIYWQVEGNDDAPRWLAVVFRLSRCAHDVVPKCLLQPWIFKEAAAIRHLYDNVIAPRPVDCQADGVGERGSLLNIRAVHPTHARDQRHPVDGRWAIGSKQAARRKRAHFKPRAVEES